MKTSDRKTRDRLKAAFGNVKDETYNFETIEKFFRNADTSEAYQVISDKTCNDLDFNEFFMFADRSTSRVGQQYLYYMLRTFPGAEDRISKHEKLINRLVNDEEFRLKIQLPLDSLNHVNTYYITSLFQEKHLEKPSWFFLIPLLSFSNLLSMLLLPFIPQFFFITLIVTIINLGIHYWNKQNLNQYIGPVPQLLRLNEIAKGLAKNPELENMVSDLLESTKVIDRVRNRMSFFRFEAKMQSDIGIGFWSLLEIIKMLFLIEPLLLFGILKQLDTKRKEISKVFSFVGLVDSLISVASMRKGLERYAVPVFTGKGGTLEAREVYHPLIPFCVANSINTNGRSVLLTGSNMSGKTSFIRTIGLNVISANTMNTCFADEFKCPDFKLFTAIRISDNLLNDRSYYFEEVLTIREMIEHCSDDSRSLFLLDEIFKGTNTVERISAGKAVLSYLENGKNIVFVSTHDIELADLLKGKYELYHFSEKVDNNTVDFDFKLKEGKLKNRNAIRILEINNYPGEIIREALETANSIDNSQSAKTV